MRAAPTLVTGATGFAGGHLLDRLAGSRAAGRLVPAGRATPAGSARQSTGSAVDSLDRRRVARGRRTTPRRRASITSPARRTSARRGRPSCRTSRPTSLGTHHLLDAVRRSGAPCRVLVVTSAQIYQASDEPIDEDAPLVPANPYGLSKLAQDELALRAAAETASTSSSRGRSITRARGRAPSSSSRASRGRSRASKPGSRRRCFASATSTRAATSPTCATSSTPTSA